MPYILSPLIKVNTEGMWAEGVPYIKENIYSIVDNKLPPVNYDSHTLKPHSITHAEAPAHVVKDGKGIDKYFSEGSYFYGKCLVVKLKGNGYKLIDKINEVYHWEVSLEELKESISRLISIDQNFEKVLLTTEFYPKNKDGYHHPNYVLTLSQESADYLISKPKFNMYGTSWKSSDFKPGSSDRPIHKTLFKKAVIFELLDLEQVPEGAYFFVGFPLRLAGASEVPVTPVLFEYSELTR